MAGYARAHTRYGAWRSRDDASERHHHGDAALEGTGSFHGDWSDHVNRRVGGVGADPRKAPARSPHGARRGWGPRIGRALTHHSAAAPVGRRARTEPGGPGRSF